MEPIAVIVAGATGKVGREVCRALTRTQGFVLAGAVSPTGAGRPVRDVLGLTEAPEQLVAAGNLDDALSQPLGASARVLVDFSTAAALRSTLPVALKRKLCPVVGTTGFAPAELTAWTRQCQEQGVGGAFIANFAIGAMLMMKFAVEARRYFPHVEIIELHHQTKLDMPSGTARRTQARLEAAGGDLQGPPVPVHSVRLPGLVANQQVIFGGPGQTLTITHDTISRECFVPGVLLAARWALTHPGEVALDLEDLTRA